MRVALARTHDVDRFLDPERLGTRRRDKDESRRAIRDQRAIQPVIGRGDHGRGQHVVDGDRLRLLRARSARRVAPHHHGGLRQLFRGGAVLLHVAVRRHREGIRDRNAERHLILLVAALRHRAQREVRRQAGEEAIAADHEDRLRKSSCYRGGADMEHGRRRRTRDLQGVREGRGDAHVLAQRDAESVEGGRESMAAQHAVDILLSQSGIPDSLEARLGGEPERTFARDLADRRDPDADDGDLTPDRLLG